MAGSEFWLTASRMTLLDIVVLQKVGDGAQFLSRFLQLGDLLAEDLQLRLLASQHFVNILHSASLARTLRAARNCVNQPKYPSITGVTCSCEEKDYYRFHGVPGRHPRPYG